MASQRNVTNLKPQSDVSEDREWPFGGSPAAQLKLRQVDSGVAHTGSCPFRGRQYLAALAGSVDSGLLESGLPS